MDTQRGRPADDEPGAPRGPEGPPLEYVELPSASGVELLIYDPAEPTGRVLETAFIPDEHEEQPRGRPLS